MIKDIFMNLVFNIGLLALVAQGITRLKSMKRLFLRSADNKGKWTDKLILSIVFGGISVMSTYTGISVQGAVVNTRVIGVMAGGILGGPAVGIGAALIAGTHRYLWDIGGLTAVACAVSTMVEGILGASVSGYVRRRRWRERDLFFFTVVAELLQMLLIVLIARPLEQAWALVEVIGLPMIIFNSFGLVAFFSSFRSIIIQQDKNSAAQVRKVLDITDQCLPYLRKGFYNMEGLNKAAEVILDETGEEGVIFTDNDRILCIRTIQDMPEIEKWEEIPSAMARAMKENKVVIAEETEEARPPGYTMLTAPLTREGEVIGSFSFLIQKYKISTDTDIDFVDGLAKIISTQLELSGIEEQKALRQKAEFAALQSQINPHFLFNALNTITAFCRERPETARELLIVLGDYFRNTLQSKSYMIDIQEELNHVKAYLQLEKARFEDRLTIIIDVPETLHANVPQFILQPLVENAVEHGAMKRAKGRVEIHARNTEEGIQISVEDNGRGMSRELIEELYADCMPEGKVGLCNVHKRLKNIYGETKGIKIESTDEGTKMQFVVS